MPLKHANVGNGTSPSPAGLIACYGGDGNANDVVGGHNASVTGTVSYTAGVFGQAFSIGAVDADIVAPASPSWDLSAGDGISLAAWFQPNGNAWGGVPGSGPIAEFEQGSQIWVHSQVDNPLTGFFADFAIDSNFVNWRIAQKSGFVVQGAWNHGVATYSKTSGVIRLYVNGALINTTTVGSFSPSSGARPFHIGARVPSSFSPPAKYTFNGLIDEVQIYNRELTQADVTQMFTATGTMCVPPATQFKVTQQPSTSGESGVPLAVQPVVQLLDASGNVVSNGSAAVTASLTASSTGTLSGTTTVNAVNGIATFTDLTINGGGFNQLQFTVGALPNTGSGTTATVTTQVVRKLGIVTQPVGATSGSPFATQPVIELQDAAGLHMNGTNPVSVTLSTGPGVLGGGATTINAVNGTASFSNLAIVGAGTTTLAFSSPGLAGVTSASVITTALGGSALAVVPPNGAGGGPLQAESGVPFATQPVVNVVDALGGVVFGATNAVTATLTTPGGTLVGTKTVNAANGVATFTNLQIDAPAGNYVLTFSTPGFPSVTSTVAVHQVTRSFVLLVDGSDVYSGAAIAPAPAVELRDAAGLKNATATDSVTVSGYLAAVQPFGGTTTVAAVAGVATFPNIVVTGRPGYGQPVYALIFSAPGATTLNVNVIHNVWLPGTHPTNIVVARAPSGAESGVPFTTQPIVNVVDARGVIVASANNVITASVTGGTGQLVGTVAATAASGVASFTNLQLNGVAGGNTLTFSTPNLPSVTVPVALTQTVRQLVITTQPSATATSGVPFTPQPVLELRDAAGLRVATATDAVTASVASGTTTLGGVATVNAVAGVATFSGLTLTGSGATTLAFADGALRATSNAIAVTQPTVVTTAALVRGDLSINGTLDGSLQLLSGEDVTLNGGAKVTGSLLVPGTPRVRLNGHPTLGATIDGTGSMSPSDYEVTLNGNASLGTLVRRVDPQALPVVAAPAAPTGTRDVTLNKAGDVVGDWSTVRDLKVNGNVGTVTLPAGRYGEITVNAGNTIVLGSAGATTPSRYDLRHLTLNGKAVLKVVGPVVVTVAEDLSVDGSAGSPANPAWLTLRVAQGDFTVNGNASVAAVVLAPKGKVTVNGGSTFIGGLAADELTVNGNALVKITAAVPVP
ncbi:MAG: hypothetical protein HY084_10875 [Gemmatimonadetes bacterium]|nr:hypothetical protein [Gemmatimonadota bacterium]